MGRLLGYCPGYNWTSFTVAASDSRFGDTSKMESTHVTAGGIYIDLSPSVLSLPSLVGVGVGGEGRGSGGGGGWRGVRGGVKLQALVYDILP